MGDETSIEMADFCFSGLQKSRITTSDKLTSCFPSVAVSSQAQIIVTCTGRTELTACPSSLIHSLRVNKENINTEFLGLPKKTVIIENIEEIISIGVSCDGKIFGALVNSSPGCFVYLYDIRVFFQDYSGPTTHFCAVRIGSEPSTKGVALEWNPTIADVFAASGSDKTVIVCSISLEEPKIYKILGLKQLPEVLTIISWSPKGKQLTAADSAGNIVQLKPELEIVRRTPVLEGLPISAPSSSLKICGLCWLATTDWLVSFSEDGKFDSYSFILKILKNKPPQWTLLPDLQYGNISSKLPPRIFTANHLLVHWNIVLICNSRTSEITVIGRTGEDWKVWSLDECGRFDLPTNEEMADTFPVGMALDISSTKTVIMEDSPTKTHRPAPILMVLNSDGVLASSHVILDQGVPSVQVKPDILNSDGVVIGNSQPSIASGEKFHTEKAKSLFAASQAPASAPQFPKTPGPSVGSSSIFGGSATPLTTASTASPSLGASTLGKGSALSSLLGEAPGTTAPTSTSLFGSTPAAVAPTSSSLFGTTPASAAPKSTSLFGSTAANATPTTTSLFGSTPAAAVPTTPLFQKATGGLFSQNTPSSSAPTNQPKPAPKSVVSPQKSLASSDLLESSKVSAETVSAPPVKDKEADLEEAKKSFMTVYNKMNEELKGLKDDIGVLHTGLQKTKPIIAESDHDIDGQEVVLEMIKTNSQLEESLSALEKQLKEAFATAAEKADIAEMFQGDKSLLKRLKETDDFDREERMKRLIINMDNLKEKYAEAKKTLEYAKKQQVSKTAHLLPSAIGSDDLINKQVRAINKSMTALRFRLDTVEDDIKHIVQVSKKLEMKKQGKATDKQAMVVNILRVQPVPAPSGDLDGMRRKMAAIVQAKLKNPPKLRRIVALPFTNETHSQSSAPKTLNFSVLQKDHAEKARSSPKPLVHMSDAATQADMVLQPSVSSTVKQPETPFSSSFSTSIATPSLISNLSKPLTSSTPISKGLTEPIFSSAGGSKIGAANNLIGADSKKDTATGESQTSDASKLPAAKPFSFASGGGFSLFGSATSQTKGASSSSSLFGNKETSEKPSEKTDLNSTSSMFGTASSPLKDAINTPDDAVGKKETAPVDLAKDSKPENKSDANSIFSSVPSSETQKLDTTGKSQAEVGLSGAAEVKKETKETTEQEKTEPSKEDAPKPFSAFGGNTASSEQKSSLFGGNTSQPTSIFGGANSDASKKSVFGAAVGEKTQPASVFGGAASVEKPQTSSVFGGTATGEKTSTISVFGGAATGEKTSTTSVFGGAPAGDKPQASSVFGGAVTAEKPQSSSVFGGSAVDQTQKSSVFGSSTNEVPKTSIFGASTTVPSTTPSVFGGTPAVAPSPFGSFGKTETAQPSTASTFSFKNAVSSSASAPTNPSGFSFSKPNVGAAGSNMGFAAAAAKAAQEGMMEDDMGDASSANKPSGFGSAFGSLSFGSSKPAETSKNVFGSVNQSANANKEGWLFKKDTNVSFGAQQQTNQSFGSFGSGQSASVFGGAQQATPAASSSAFGGAPKFGGNPSFGAKPVFGGGASPFGSSPAKGGSVFGGGASTGGFASFANNANSFGGAAQSSGGTSVFGGASGQPAQQPTASVFGGGQNKNSFNTWR